MIKGINLGYKRCRRNKKL